MLATIHLLGNTPLIKLVLKEGFGVAQMAIGAISCHDLYMESKRPMELQHWSIVLARCSLIASALVSKPMLALFGTLACTVVPSEQWTALFGLNTIFAHNPYHPRHLASFAAFAVGLLPSLVALSYTWRPAIERRDGIILSDRLTFALALGCTLTSRPALHLFNQWVGQWA